MTTRAARGHGGIEAGGSKFVCAIGTGPDRIAQRLVIPTTTPAQTLDRVVDFFATQRRAGRDVDAIGVGSFGPLDLDERSPTYGHITTTLKPGWSGTDLVGAIRNRLEVGVHLDTDANAAAYGEYRWGAGRGMSNVVYVTVGTGVGVGVVIHGQPLPGRPHPTAEHILVHRHPDDTHPSRCPYHDNCIEGLASGPALLARTGRPPGELGPDGHRLAAIEAWYLAQLVTTLSHALSPHRIVMGGGVLALPGLIEAIRDRTVELVNGALGPTGFVAHIDDYLVRPALGDSSGIVGALALAEAYAPVFSVTPAGAPEPFP